MIFIFLATIYPYKEVRGQDIIITLQSEIINFNDKNLETGIRDKLNKPKGDITKDDVKIIEDLTLNHKNISSLDEIPVFN
jgi:hypothetical protein